MPLRDIGSAPAEPILANPNSINDREASTHADNSGHQEDIESAPAELILANSFSSNEREAAKAETPRNPEERPLNLL